MPSLAVVKSSYSGNEGQAPEWLVAHMPPGYRNRYEEIQRLSNEIKGMDRVGRLLWDGGDTLRESVYEAFAALKTEPEWTENGALLTVKLEGGRRLLVHVADNDGPHEKKSDAVAGAFRVLQEVAGPKDRTVLLTTGERELAPQERGETVSEEAHDLLRRMGVNVMPAAALFAIWMESLTELNDARARLDALHAQDGGTFKRK